MLFNRKTKCVSKEALSNADLEAKVNQLEQELAASRLSEKRFLDALRLSPMALCHHDRDLKYTWLYNGHMGFVQDEVIGKTDWDILDHDLAERMGKVKRRVLETGKGERIEMPTVAGDENSEYFDLVVEPLRDTETGEVVGLSCSGIDVTEDRRRREAFRAGEENLRFIFNASPMPIMVLHQEGGAAVFYNRAAQKLFDLSRDNDRKKCSDRGNFLENIGLTGVLERLRTGGGSLQIERFDFSIKPGETFHLSLSAKEIFYEGKPCVLATFSDLTQEIKYRRYLEQARADAEQASQAKSRFLASASHDLRQPLHAMGLLLGVLEEHVDTPQGRKVLGKLSNSLDSMNDLFSGILDISKLDANAVETHLEGVCLQLLFMQLCEEFAPLGQDKNIEIRFVPTRLWIKTDLVQMSRLLRNFISNALRYSPPETRILIGARLKGTQVRLYVFDQGPGIAEQDRALIFQEFHQLNNPERDRRKGLGLGLAICQRIARLLGSEIGLQSTLGRGSVFSISQPLHSEAFEKPLPLEPDEQITPLGGRSLVLVEDEIDVQHATAMMLESWGAQVCAGADAKTCLEQLEKTRMRPDIIIADYRLRAGATGLEAIKEIRTHFNQNIAALIVTGETAPDVLVELQASTIRLLNKPLSAPALKKALQSLLENN